MALTKELNTPFRWYDDVSKQNRYKDFCQQVCDYQLITPCDRFLPFQIKTDGVAILGLTQWIVYDIDGNQVADLSICITSNIEVKTVDGYDYIIFKDASLTNCGFVLDCGTYYSILTDGTTYWYSELFEVVNLSDYEFYQELFQPIIPWRWYDNSEKLNELKTNCKQNCDFCLLSSNESLLPFQFKRPKSIALIEQFYLISKEDASCGVTLTTDLIQIVTIGDHDYLIYGGANIDGLTPGTYYGYIVSGGITYYSEPICINCDLGEGNFLLQETGYKILQENNDGILLEQ